MIIDVIEDYRFIKGLAGDYLASHIIRAHHDTQSGDTIDKRTYQRTETQGKKEQQRKEQ